MTEHEMENRKFVRVSDEGTGFKAELKVGQLNAAGIPAYAQSEGPLDEFSMAMRAMGTGVAVLVPEDRLEDARRVLAGAAPEGASELIQDKEALVDQAAADQEDDLAEPSSRTTATLLILMLATGFILVLMKVLRG